MRGLLISALLLVLGSMTGCASASHGLVLDPVGPPPFPSPPGIAKGSLIVFSAFDPNAHFNSSPYADFYTDYTIFSGDGKLLQKVHNNPSPSVPGPAKVRLPAGAYCIVARANGYGRVTVPVVIQPHQTTTVHLEGQGTWRSQPAMTQAQAVRLPDGQIVGWRADPKDPSPTTSSSQPSDHDQTSPR